MSFEVRSRFESVDAETDRAMLSGECVIRGEIVERHGHEAARISVQTRDNATDTEVTLDYYFSDDRGNLAIEMPELPGELPPTGEPVTDYSLCVALKLSSAIGQAGAECYKRTNGWKEFLKCMKQKAPELGMNAIWTLFTCLRKLLPI